MGEQKKQKKTKKQFARQTYLEVVSGLLTTVKRLAKKLRKKNDTISRAHLKTLEAVLHFISFKLSNQIEDATLYNLELPLHKIKNMLFELDGEFYTLEDAEIAGPGEDGSKRILTALKSIRHIVSLPTFTNDSIDLLNELLLFCNDFGLISPKVKIKNGRKKTRTGNKDTSLPSSETNKLLEMVSSELMKIPQKPYGDKFTVSSTADAVAQDAVTLGTVYSNAVIELAGIESLESVMKELKSAFGQGDNTVLFGNPWVAGSEQELMQIIDTEILKLGFSAEKNKEDELNYENPPPEAILGTGRFGKVLVGKRFGNDLAFKHISMDDVREKLSPNARGELINEIQTYWRKFDKHSIVKLYDTFILDDVLFLTMERMEMSLDDLLHGFKGDTPPYQMSDLEITGACSAIMSGLNFLHSKDIIHQDIHPGNILLKGVQKKPVVNINNVTVKLTDFGSNSVKSDLTIPNGSSYELQELRRKLKYGAPEVISNDKWTFASDIYSFGLVWWEMTVKDRKPYEDVKDIFTAIVKNKQRPELSSSQKPWMAQLIRNSWAHLPWNRPTTQMLKNIVVTQLTKMLKQRKNQRQQFTMGRPKRNQAIAPTLVVDSDSKGPNAAVLSVLSTTQTSQGRLPSLRRSIARRPSNASSARRASSVVLQTQNFDFMESKESTIDLGGAIKIVRTMKANRNDPAVLERALGVLKHMADSSFGIKLIRIGAGVECIKSMKMYPNDPDIQAVACGFICNLAFTDTSSTALARSGAVGYILKALKDHYTNSDVQEEGLKALTNLSSSDERKKAILVLGAAEQVLLSLRSHLNNEAVVEEACAAITSLQEGFSEGNELSGLGPDFYELNSIRFLKEGLERHKFNAEVFIEACKAIREICKVNSERKKHVVELGILPLLADGMTRYASLKTVNEAGCSLIYTLASGRGNIPEAILENGLDKLVIRILANYTKPDHEDLQMRCIFSLYNLAYQNKNVCKKLKAQDALKVLKATVSKYPKSSPVKQKGEATIKIIAGGGK